MSIQHQFGIILAMVFVVAVGIVALIPSRRRAGSCRGRAVGPVFWLIALGFLHAAADKPGGITRPVLFPSTDLETRYLSDVDSVVSNDFVHVNFVASVVLPSDAPIYLDYSQGTNTEVWASYTNATLATFPRPLDFEFPGAITNAWMCYTTWTPGPTVHTNGVAQINWQLPTSGETNICAILNTAIYTNSTKVVTQ